MIFSINGRWVVIHVELFHPEPWPTYAYRDNRLMAHLLDDRSMSEGSIEPASRATSNPLSYICDTVRAPFVIFTLTGFDRPSRQHEAGFANHWATGP